MNMPENSNISESALEETFDRKVSVIISKDSALDDAIWQNTRELLDYELEKHLVWQRIKYFVSASAAAVIVTALVIYLIFSPQGIPSDLLSAMEKEHQSFIQGDVKLPSDAPSAEELSEQFRQKGLLDEKSCCCALMSNNKNIQLQGGRVCNMGNCPYATIYAKYNGTPISFFIFNQSGQPGLIAQSKLVHIMPQLGVYKKGGFNVAIKLLPDCVIGVIAKLDKQTLIDLVRDIDTLKGKCNCGCK